VVIVADDGAFAIGDALDELYSVAPDAFTACRTRLVAAAKAAGDAAAARQIGSCRKPTVAAWVANLIARQGAAAALTDLGDRLREAHAAGDGNAIRALTHEQRRLVDELTRSGFAAAGQQRPSAAVRDDVTATLQAAVADPDVAGRLGRLTKAEQWSGFADFGTVTARSSPKPAKREPSPAPVTRPSRSRTPDPAAARAAAELAAATRAKADADAALTELQTDVAAARLRAQDARRRFEAAEQALGSAEAALRAAEDAYASGKQTSREAAAALATARSSRRPGGASAG
jgi:hypothetical protein